MRRRLSLIGTMLLHKGDVDGLICGTWGTNATHLPYVEQVIGKRPGVNTFACMNGLLLPNRQVFLVDTHVNYDPTAEQLAEITVMAAQEMKRFGIRPKVALLSHSNFGTSNEPSAVKMRDTLALLQKNAPWLEVDGEMHGDIALDGDARALLMPNSTLQGDANLLVCPNIDAANISYNLLKTAAGGHFFHHVLFQHTTSGQAQEHIGALNGLGQCALRCFLRKLNLVFVHQLGAAFVDQAC